jgi:hypothetical protein
MTPRILAASGIALIAIGLICWAQEALGIQRGHAAGAGRGDRLAVDLVHHVAAREHAGHAGPRRAGLDLDIMVRIELEMPAEQLGRRVVADRDEAALDIEPRELAGHTCPSQIERDQALGNAAAATKLDLLFHSTLMFVWRTAAPAGSSRRGTNRGGGSGSRHGCGW